MRRVVTGIDAEGRSTVLDDSSPPVAFQAGPAGMVRIDGEPSPDRSVVYQLWSLGASPQRGGPDPTTAMTVAEFHTPPGETSWIITHMAPGAGAPMHDTPTVDYGVVVAGEVELGLETGAVTLRAGDAVLVDGVLHSWKPGPDGCVLATVQVGLAR